MTEPLDTDEILAAEFGHISQVYGQNNEDRARVSTFYLVTVASIIAALLSFDPNNTDATSINTAFAILFFVLSLTGLITLFQLVKLRQAWIESVNAMNIIKDYYVRNAGDNELISAFLWTNAPANYKTWSLSSILAFQVAVLGGATLGAAIVFGLAAFNIYEVWMLAPTILAGLLFTGLQLYLYKNMLQK